MLRKYANAGCPGGTWECQAAAIHSPGRGLSPCVHKAAGTITGLWRTAGDQGETRGS